MDTKNKKSNQYNMEKLEDDVVFIKTTVSTIKQCLYGEPKNHTDGGLISDVRDNTKFRRTALGWLTTITIGIIMLYLKTYLIG